MEEQSSPTKKRLDIPSGETWYMPHYVGDFLCLATPVFYHWFHCCCFVFISCLQNYEEFYEWKKFFMIMCFLLVLFPPVSFLPLPVVTFCEHLYVMYSWYKSKYLWHIKFVNKLLTNCVGIFFVSVILFYMEFCNRLPFNVPKKCRLSREMVVFTA